MNQHNRRFVSDSEVPPHAKVRAVATVDRKLSEEMERIHMQEIERAKAEDRTEPDWSNTIEMLLRKGIRSYRTNQRKTNCNLTAGSAVRLYVKQIICPIISNLAHKDVVKKP